MAVLTLEGVVEAGQIRLLNGEHLPEKTNVYVVVPNVPTAIEPIDAKIKETIYSVSLHPNARVVSPRLANRDDAPHFAVEVSE